MVSVIYFTAPVNYSYGYKCGNGCCYSTKVTRDFVRIYTSLCNFETLEDAMEYKSDSNMHTKMMAYEYGLENSPICQFSPELIKSDRNIEQGVKSLSDLVFRPNILDGYLTNEEFNLIYRSWQHPMPMHMAKADYELLRSIVGYYNTQADYLLATEQMIPNNLNSQERQNRLEFISKLTHVVHKVLVVNQNGQCLEIMNPIKLVRLASRAVAKQLKDKSDIERLTINTAFKEHLKLDFTFNTKIKNKLQQKKQKQI